MVARTPFTFELRIPADPVSELVVLEAIEAIALAPRVRGPVILVVPFKVLVPDVVREPLIVVVARVAEVVAVSVPKVALDPVNVPMVAVMALRAEATRLLMKELVLVLLVITPLVAARLVVVALLAIRFVVVAFAAVRFVKNPVVAFTIAAMMLVAESP